jgi:hypothetical protein
VLLRSKDITHGTPKPDVGEGGLRFGTVYVLKHALMTAACKQAAEYGAYWMQAPQLQVVFICKFWPHMTPLKLHVPILFR